MNVYTKLFEEAQRETEKKKINIRESFYQKLEEEHLINKNNERQYISFESVLNQAIESQKEHINGKYKVASRNETPKYYELGKKVLETFSNLLLINATYEQNQEDLLKYDTKYDEEDCKILFRNKSINEYSGEQYKIKINEQIEYYIFCVFESMLSYSNGSIYVKLLRDRYITLRHYDKDEIAERNHMSTRDCMYKLKHAIGFFGEMLITFGNSE